MGKIIDMLRRAPYIINANNWYYEEEKGIEVIHQRAPNDHIHITIPWHKLVRSTRRYQEAIAAVTE